MLLSHTRGGPQPPSQITTLGKLPSPRTGSKRGASDERTVSDTRILASLLSHNAVTLCNQHEMFTAQGLSQNKLLCYAILVPLKTAGIGMVLKCPDSGSCLDSDPKFAGMTRMISGDSAGFIRGRSFAWTGPEPSNAQEWSASRRCTIKQVISDHNLVTPEGATAFRYGYTVRRRNYRQTRGGLPDMNILVIGNPVAGRGRALQRIFRFVELLEGKGHAVETFLTEKPGDAALRASRIRADVERLVVAGGDGTINEVLNGLPDPSAVPLVPLASGTANMLATDLSIPTQPEALAELVDTGKVRRLDMGLAGDRRFLSLISAGFDAAVTQVLHERRGKKLGYVGYSSPIVRAALRHRPVELEVTVDGGDSIVGKGAMILKARNYGGYFVFAEDACRNSGCFHVRVFSHSSLAAVLRYALAGLARRAARLGDVVKMTGLTIRIESADPVPVEIDGDYFGTTPVTATLEPVLVPVLSPRNS
jgi:diacylglycerol kinase (ATP)